jgi:hypothetical protein
MMSAIWTYRSFAILRTEYWLIHPISTAAFIVIQDLEKGSAEMNTLVQACQCLFEMSDTLPLAPDTLATIKAAFVRSKVLLPPNVQRFFEGATHRGDGLMHHVIASLMPAGKTHGGASPADHAFWLSFQELLNEMETTTLA